VQLRKMAARWLVERRERPYADELRFDAIGVTVDPAGRLVALEHVEQAF
jgi:putative endonuclease